MVSTRWAYFFPLLRLHIKDAIKKAMKNAAEDAIEDTIEEAIEEQFCLVAMLYRAFLSPLSLFSFSIARFYSSDAKWCASVGSL